MRWENLGLLLIPWAILEAWGYEVYRVLKRSFVFGLESSPLTVADTHVST